MTKQDLARAMAQELNLPQVRVREIVQRVLDGITQTLVNEGRIELRNFGVFRVKKRRPRKAPNPRTGENMKVPARLAVNLKPGQQMDERIGQLQKLLSGREGVC